MITLYILIEKDWDYYQILALIDVIYLVCHQSVFQEPPENAFLYKDIDGVPIILTHGSDHCRIWRYRDKHGYEYDCKISYNSKFYLTTLGKMIFITSTCVYYTPFKLEQSPYNLYKLVLGKVPETDEPLYVPEEKLFLPTKGCPPDNQDLKFGQIN